MTHDALLQAVRDAKHLYDHGAFSTLHQAEFFKAVEAAYLDVAPESEPEPEPEPERKPEPVPAKVAPKVPLKPPKG